MGGLGGGARVRVPCPGKKGGHAQAPGCPAHGPRSRPLHHLRPSVVKPAGARASHAPVVVMTPCSTETPPQDLTGYTHTSDTVRLISIVSHSGTSVKCQSTRNTRAAWGLYGFIALGSWRENPPVWPVRVTAGPGSPPPPETQSPFPLGQSGMQSAPRVGTLSPRSSWGFACPALCGLRAWVWPRTSPPLLCGRGT